MRPEQVTEVMHDPLAHSDEPGARRGGAAPGAAVVVGDQADFPLLVSLTSASDLDGLALELYKMGPDGEPDLVDEVFEPDHRAAAREASPRGASSAGSIGPARSASINRLIVVSGSSFSA